MFSSGEDNSEKIRKTIGLKFFCKCKETDITLSTRFDDKPIIQKSTMKETLAELKAHIAAEIKDAFNCVIKLERLRDRYYADRDAALVANDMGYFGCYQYGIDWIENIVNLKYNNIQGVN